MTTTQAHKSPPGASGLVHDAPPSHGLASASIRPNTRRGGVAALLVAAILVELALFAVIVRSII
jgi:hypothetical protein